MNKALIRLTICKVAALLVAGCAGYRGESTSQCSTCATSVISERGSGGIISHVPSKDASAVARVAAKYCEERHLGAPTIGEPRNDSRNWYPYVYYDFNCRDRETDVAAMRANSPQPAVAQQPVDEDVEKLGATCASIGFQKGTPDYGNCVLKLMEMRNAQAGQGAALSVLQQQQLRQLQREQAIKMLQQGLSGLSAQPPNATAPTTPTTTTIQLPSGEIVTCTKTGDQVNCN
jgi:hypothetical protein